MAVDQGHDMWVVEALEYIDLGRKVFFELFVKLRQVDGLDRYIGFRLCMDTLIDRRETTSPDLVEPRIATDGHFWTGGLA